MNAKTMEGLVGARTNINLLNTPMRVFKEANRKGDTATMERALGYAGDFADKAEEYKAEAGKGMEEDAKETKEAKFEREKAIQKRRKESEKLENKIEEDRNTAPAKISGEGRTLLVDHAGSINKSTDEIKGNAKKEPVAYTKTGKAIPADPSTSISVSVRL